MNIALIGFGKMGHEIEAIAKAKGHSITAIIDPTGIEHAQIKITEQVLQDVDVCIDFSRPEAVVDNIKKLAALKKNIVVGTTGWYDQLDVVKTLVQEAGIGLLYASNFSVGVHIFFAMIENAAQIINKLDDYDAFCYELHHQQKLDSPSGTAMSIGNILINNIERKTKLSLDRINGKVNPEELHIASIRAGTMPGTHVVGFDSEADTIELKHTARNRSGFAAGAVIAAQWLHNRTGFYDLQDFMQDLIGKNK